MLEINSNEVDSNWVIFERNFTTIYPLFFTHLLDQYPDLTTAEKRMCSFLKMGLSIPEISSITKQSKNSLYVLKTRLKSKMNFEETSELEKFVMDIE